MKPTVRFVSELFHPETTSTGYFVTGIAVGLADEADVHVVASRPTYSERGQRVPWREEYAGVNIHRVWSTTFAKDWTPGRVLNMLTFSSLAAMTALFRFRRTDTVLVLTNPPLATLLLAIVLRVRRMRGVLLVHDVYPEVLHATGHIKAGSAIDAVFRRLMRWVFRSYDDIVVLGRDMAELFRGKLGDDHRITIIPNWGDAAEVKPVGRSENPFASAYRLSGRTVVQFSGNLGRTHDIETVLAAAGRLRARQDLRFLFVGYGGKTGLIANAEKELSNVLFAPRQPREMLGPMLACSDATLIAFTDNMLGVSVPSRMYNVMAAGAPIIALADGRSELARVVREEGCGWTLATGDVDGLCSLLEFIDTEQGKAEAARRGAAGRRAMMEHYTANVVIERFKVLLGPRDHALPDHPVRKSEHS